MRLLAFRGGLVATLVVISLKETEGFGLSLSGRRPQDLSLCRRYLGRFTTTVRMGGNSSSTKRLDQVAVAGPTRASAKSRALAQSKGKVGHGLTAVVPAFDTAHSIPNVDITPDLEATEFSCQNAFFFAKMSDIAYSTREEVRQLMEGDGSNKGLGFDHFHWFEADKEESEKCLLEDMFDKIEDTEAFVVANDDMILVVFRGTSETNDWLTNLKFATRRVPPEWGLGGEGCDIHEGFDDGVNTVWDGAKGMRRTIKALYEEKGKSRKLFITGHSLGGALATIAAGRLAFVDNMNIAGMYTIGSPRVFDGELAAKFDSKLNHGTLLKDKYFRCRNNNDIVPRIVPLPYAHVGTEIYLDRFGALGVTNIWDHILGRLSAYLRMSVMDGINDHSASEYIRHFKQLVINPKVSLLDKVKSVVKDVTEKVTPYKTKNSKLQQLEIEETKRAA